MRNCRICLGKHVLILTCLIWSVCPPLLAFLSVSFGINVAKKKKKKKSNLFTSALHDLLWYGVDLMVKSYIMLQSFFKVNQQCSEVCSSQIQGKVLSLFWKNTKKISQHQFLYKSLQLIHLLLDN